MENTLFLVDLRCFRLDLGPFRPVLGVFAGFVDLSWAIPAV